MRIVATSDTHFDFDSGYWPEGDVFIHAGDLMYTGQLDEWKGKLNSLKAVKAKHKLYIPGNHDYYPFHFEGLAAAQLRKQADTKMIRPHDPIITIPGTTLKLLGVPYVTGLPGWAYNVAEEWLLTWLKETTAHQRIDVVVSHAPMFNILDAIRPEAATPKEQEHVGGLAMNRWFHELDERNRPLVWINGHIHESYGQEMHEGCHFYNVAHCDRQYQQNNQPVVIDI